MQKAQALREHPYFRLMRLHQPVGIWLLLWPCWWAVALASDGIPPLSILALFALGALLMRAAGCIINDLTDKEFDKAVARTRTRPLASGAITPREAFIVLALLLLLALGVALVLGKKVLFWCLPALPLVVAYPWMKRITWWPQAFLGLTFNWGALVGWVAVRGTVEWPALLLYAAGVFWTLGYDTIYAHQDKEDDARIGVKSSALRLGRRTRPALAGFYGLMLLFLILCGIMAQADFLYYVLLSIVAADAVWQVFGVKLEDTASCNKTFKHNGLSGFMVFLATLAA